MEQRRLKFLDYPASKQFLIRVMGDLREEISGRNIPHPQEFAFKDESITSDSTESIEAWLKVIDAVLPTIVEDLPAEDYEVVRSNEHTVTVVGRVRGIVAGASALQPNFEDLRGLLKPA